MIDTSHTVKVAAAQLPARTLEHARQALDDIEQAVRQASEARAQLVVLPECSYPCYWLGKRQQYLEADILDSPAVEVFFGDLARRYRIHIAAGVIHCQDGEIYDAAILFDPAGQLIGRHFKTFLWDREHDWYVPGHSIQPIESSLGRIGMLVCAEGRSPEVFASHATQRAGLLAMPTAWVNAASQPGKYYNPQPDFMIRARALEFGLPIICANKFGQEGNEARFCGMSLIVSGDGQVLAEAPADQPAVLTAEVEVSPQPLLLVDATARRLLEAESVLPSRDARPTKLALTQAKALSSMRDPVDMKYVFSDLASRGISLAVACGNLDDDMSALQLVGIANEAGIQLITNLDAGKNIIANGVTLGCLAGRQLESFALSRLLALAGAQTLCHLGGGNNLATLRTRAVENRVFVVAVSEEEALLISPGGTVLARQPFAGNPVVVELDLSQAADKQVAPQTDVWRERRIAAYRLLG